MQYFVFWLICGFVAAAVANSRGASGCAGLFWGILLGPFGIIIAFILNPKNPQPVLTQTARSETEEGEQRICPHCRSYIPSAATVCRYCQRESDAVAIAEPNVCLRTGGAHEWARVFDRTEECNYCGKQRRAPP